MSEPSRAAPFRVHARQVTHDVTPAGVHRRIRTLLSAAALTVTLVTAFHVAASLPWPSVPGEQVTAPEAPAGQSTVPEPFALTAPGSELSPAAPDPAAPDPAALNPAVLNPLLPPTPGSSDVATEVPFATDVPFAAVPCPLNSSAPCPDGRGMGPFLPLPPDSPVFWLSLLLGTLAWGLVNLTVGVTLWLLWLLLLLPSAPLNWLRRGTLMSEHLPWRLWSPRLLLSVPAPLASARSALMAAVLALTLLVCAARLPDAWLFVALLLFGLQRWLTAGLRWCRALLSPHVAHVSWRWEQEMVRREDLRWERESERRRGQDGRS